jgi:hypothetical protein
MEENIVPSLIGMGITKHKDQENYEKYSKVDKMLFIGMLKRLFLVITMMETFVFS